MRKQNKYTQVLCIAVFSSFFYVISHTQDGLPLDPSTSEQKLRSDQCILSERITVRVFQLFISYIFEVQSCSLLNTNH